MSARDPIGDYKFFFFAFARGHESGRDTYDDRPQGSADTIIVSLNHLNCTISHLHRANTYDVSVNEFAYTLASLERAQLKHRVSLGIAWWRRRNVGQRANIFVWYFRCSGEIWCTAGPTSCGVAIITNNFFANDQCFLSSLENIGELRSTPCVHKQEMTIRECVFLLCPVACAVRPVRSLRMIYEYYDYVNVFLI